MVEVHEAINNHDRILLAKLYLWAIKVKLGLYSVMIVNELKVATQKVIRVQPMQNTPKCNTSGSLTSRS